MKRSEPKIAFQKTLTSLLKINKLTQEEVAEVMGVKRQTVSQYCNGVTVPTIDKLEKLADYFDVSADYLLGRGKQVPEKQPEWISIEDRLPAAGELVLVSTKNNRIATYAFSTDSICDKSITHWMPLPEPPKPKESTFKDVFLGSFPKANIDMITHIICVRSIFPHTKPNMIDCAKYDCEKCWNQPYFEEE